jgi:hypothetical protein
LGDVVLIDTVPVVGTTPPAQLLPTIQSLLVAPVHVCAAAGAARAAITAAHDAPANSSRFACPMLPPYQDRLGT